MKVSRRLGYPLAVLAAAILTTRADAAEMTPASLKAVEAKVRAVVAKALPCTVALISKRTGAAGSGVVVSEDGLILTAGHVTRATGDELVVYFPDGKTAEATALGADYRKDSGMARIVDEGPYPFVELGESGELEENQWCVALGHTAGYQADRTPPVRLGRILAERVGEFISTDCALTGGDSGGPLFDLDGRLIGIHSNIGTSLTENRHIPIDTYRTQWEDLLEGARLNDWNPPMFGVWLDDEIKNGVRVEVMENGPADEAGLKTDDIILSVEGKETRTGDGLLVEISKCRPGKPAEVEVLRGEQRLTFEVTPTSRRQLNRAGNLRWQGGRSRRGGPRTPQPSPGREDERSSAEPGDQKPDEQPRAENEPAEASDDKQPEPADAGGSDDGEAEDSQLSEEARIRKLEEELAKRIRDARQNGGEVEIPPELQERYPNLEQLGRRMAEFLGRGFSLAPPAEDTFFNDVVTGYRSINDKAAESVVKVMVEDRQVALGTVVREDGYVLTKASEVKDAKPTIELADGQRFDALVETEFKEYDLVLLRVPAKLTPAAFSPVADQLPLGSFVSAVGVDPTPLAIGVLSVARRSLALSDRPFLGISLQPAEGGLAISSVVEDTAASAAGLQEGDIIRSLDGDAYTSVTMFINSLGRKRPGDEVRLRLVRDGEEFERVVKLGARPEMPREPTRNRYPTGGKLSKQRDGYPDAIQTDLPFQFNQCGSPLVDLEGRIIGLNIARAGRTRSYAIPAATISELMQKALPQ